MVPNHSGQMLKATFVSDICNDEHDVVLRRRQGANFGLQFDATSAAQSSYTVQDQRPDLVFFSRSVTRAAVKSLARRFSGEYDVVNGNSTNAPASSDEALSRLTVRQLEVLQVYARGNTQVQAAQILGVAEKTIDGHLHRIRHVLGVHDKSRLTIFCIACGIISLYALPNYSELQSQDSIE